jgi:hypothetical protein
MLTKNPIEMKEEHKGFWVLTYFGEEVGVIEKLTRNNKRTDVPVWRVCSVHGELDYCGSLGSARSRLMEMHH